MVHSDCGAYGGLRAFGGSEEREAENYQIELRRATDFLQQNVSTVDLEWYYLRFSGVWTLDQG
jgi:hypothetical protein